MNIDGVTRVIARQAAAMTTVAAAATAIAASDTSSPACSSNNDFDGRVGTRVSAIFVILAGSIFGKQTSTRLLEPIIRNILTTSRSHLSRLCTEQQGSQGTRMGILHRKVFWVRGDHSNRFHTCTQAFPLLYLETACVSPLTSRSSLPLPIGPLQIPVSQE